MTEDRAVFADLSFDAWASARLAGLLRFAYLVTGSQHAADYHAQVYDGGFESAPNFCDDSSERVLITITGDDPYGGPEVTQATVVDPFCREVSGSPAIVSPLSDAGIAAWTQNGLQVTLYALIGPQG